MQFAEHDVYRSGRARVAAGVIGHARRAPDRSRLASAGILSVPKRPPADRIEVKSSAAPTVLAIATLVVLFIAGAWASDLKITDLHWPTRQTAPQAVAILEPKGRAENWVLMNWLPTVLEAPYGASAACEPAPRGWACTVEQTRTATPLPASERRRWRVRLTPYAGLFIATSVRPL